MELIELKQEDIPWCYGKAAALRKRKRSESVTANQRNNTSQTMNAERQKRFAWEGQWPLKLQAKNVTNSELIFIICKKLDRTHPIYLAFATHVVRTFFSIQFVDCVACTIKAGFDCRKQRERI